MNSGGVQRDWDERREFLGERWCKAEPEYTDRKRSDTCK